MPLLHKLCWLRGQYHERKHCWTAAHYKYRFARCSSAARLASCRSIGSVDSAMSDPHQNSDELRERMQELLDLYHEMVSICQGERQRIADELRQINQSKQSAKVYQMFGWFIDANTSPKCNLYLGLFSAHLIKRQFYKSPLKLRHKIDNGGSFDFTSGSLLSCLNSVLCL